MLKKLRVAFLLVALAMLTSVFAACGGSSTTSSSTPTATTAASGPTCVNGSISFDGSSALYPLANAVAGSYQDACSGATINGKSSGSGTGLKNASSGAVDIGNSDIFGNPAQYPGLTDHQVAVVVFSVVLNAKVTGVSNLTSQQLINIYKGTTTNWSQVGGPNLPIITVSRSAGSGTRFTFDQFVLNGGNPTGPNAEKSGDSASLTASQSSDLAAAVKSTDGAVGYVTTFFAGQNNLHTVSIDGVAATNANVESNAYKFWNLEHMYTKGTATGLADAFIKYMESDSPDVVAARQANGFLAIGEVSSSAVHAKQVTTFAPLPTPTPTTAPTPTA